MSVRVQIEEYIDDLRHNSERRSYPGFDVRTANSIADELEELLEGSDGGEWFIHRFECPDCDAITRADRAVGCYRCGSEMDHAEKVGVLSTTGTDQGGSI